jgi:hypothetical protein
MSLAGTMWSTCRVISTCLKSTAQDASHLLRSADVRPFLHPFREPFSGTEAGAAVNASTVAIRVVATVHCFEHFCSSVSAICRRRALKSTSIPDISPQHVSTALVVARSEGSFGIQRPTLSDRRWLVRRPTNCGPRKAPIPGDYAHQPCRRCL